MTFQIRTTCLLLTFAAQLMFAGVNYSYDAAGRLIKIDYGAAGSIAYTYDKAGNLLSRSVSSSGATGGVITSVNTAGSPASAGITQNAWIEIKGTNLAPLGTGPDGMTWDKAPSFESGVMPDELGGVHVFHSLSR